MTSRQRQALAAKAKCNKLLFGGQTRFHIGDVVRVTTVARRPTRVGKVVEVLPGKPHPYHVGFPDGLVAWFHQDEMRLVKSAGAKPDWDEECI